jgi:hypothetical protein
MCFGVYIIGQHIPVGKKSISAKQREERNFP